MPESLPPAPRAWQRYLMLLVASVVIVHSAVVGLWLSPDNPIRDSVGSSNLASYVNPYFRQSPTAMDPGAQYADEALLVRARILDADGEVVETEWADLTKTGSGWLSTRMDEAARALATNLNAALYEFDGTQKDLVAQDFVENNLADLEAQLLENGVTSIQSRQYFASHAMATQFATLSAAAIWDGTVEQVQLRVGLRRVPDHDRHVQRLSDVDFTWFDFGWREPIVGNQAAQEAFDDYMGS